MDPKLLDILIGGAAAVVGFLIKGTLHKLDSAKEDTGKARERIGQIEMRVDASFRNIDDLKADIKELRQEIRARAS